MPGARQTDAVAEPRTGEALPSAKDREQLRFWRDALRRRMLAGADLVTAAIASAVITSSLATLMWALAFVPGWILVAKLIGLYDRDHTAIRHLTIDEVPAVAAWTGVSIAALGVLLPLTPAGEVSPGAAASSWLIATVAALTGRSIARALWRRLTPPEVTIVLGAGDLAGAIRRKLELFPDMHLELAESDPDSVAVGDLADRVDRIIVATERVDVGEVADLVALCRERQVKLSVVSPLHGRAGPVKLSRVADLPVLEYETWDQSRSTAVIKRGFDLAGAGLGLLVTAPLFPLIALAIKLDSRGPVFFSQRRAGLDGESFRVHKFRTMCVDAEQRLVELVVIDELEEPAFKFRDDPRVTRAGKFLRRTSLDELPQLWNVLKGEMSIVGPRPEQYELVQRYRPEHRFRLSVKPGLTGPMQVFGRGDLTFQERLAVELDYIENVSLARDLKILAQTIPVALRGHGAY